MNIKKLVIATLVAGSAVSSAFAAETFHPLGGEGFIQHRTPSDVTRAQVENELAKAQQGTLGTSNGKPLAGDTGYAQPKHSYAIQNGGVVHTDKINHSAAKPEISYAPPATGQSNIYLN